MDLPEKIKKIRADNELSYRQFAEYLSLSGFSIDPGNLSKIEKGIIKPGTNFYFALSKIFKVNMNWLFADIGEPYLNKIDLVHIKNKLEV